LNTKSFHFETSILKIKTGFACEFFRFTPTLYHF
jgi:hypothetical protein